MDLDLNTIEAEHIRKAMDAYDINKDTNKSDSSRETENYFIFDNGKEYPMKSIMEYAYKKANKIDPNKVIAYNYDPKVEKNQKNHLNNKGFIVVRKTHRDENDYNENYYTLIITKDKLKTEPEDKNFDKRYTENFPPSKTPGKAEDFGLRKSENPIAEARFKSDSRCLSTVNNPDYKRIKSTSSTADNKDFLTNGILQTLCIDAFKNELTKLSDEEKKDFNTTILSSSRGIYTSIDNYAKVTGDSSRFGKVTRTVTVTEKEKEIKTELVVNLCYAFTGIPFAQSCLERWCPEGSFELTYRVGSRTDTSEIVAAPETDPNILNTKQLIFAGPPGTGKTRAAKIRANQIVSKNALTDDHIDNSKHIRLIQLHPSYSYSDFLETIEINTDNNSFEPKDKVFKELAIEAEKNPDDNYVLIIDEINRANIAEVFGELLYGLEYRGTEYTSQLSSKPFSIPNNLYIIGTMNTADRSLQHLDYAVRRRFSFEKILSEPPKDAEKQNDILGTDESEQKFFCRPAYEKVKEDISKSVARGVDPDDIMPGISYFLVNLDNSNDHFDYKMKYELVPLLKEYVNDGLLRRKGDFAKHLKDGAYYKELSDKYEEPKKPEDNEE